MVSELTGMTAGVWLRETRDRLEAVGIDTASLDARLLLLDGLSIPHSVIVAEPQLQLSKQECQALEMLVLRRLEREPISRIFGIREFWGRNFTLTPDVLDPRADTETLIDAVLVEMGDRSDCRVLDIGTGSGCIAVTLMAERVNWSGVATDISDQALNVARTNARSYGVTDRLQFIPTSWADGLDGQFDLICSNPPYIVSGDISGLQPEVRNYDPAKALDGGSDGLEAYRILANVIGGLLADDGRFVVEIGSGQASSVRSILEAEKLLVSGQKRDLSGHVRVLIACKA